MLTEVETQQNTTSHLMLSCLRNDSEHWKLLSDGDVSVFPSCHSNNTTSLCVTSAPYQVKVYWCDRSACKTLSFKLLLITQKHDRI